MNEDRKNFFIFVGVVAAVVFAAALSRVFAGSYTDKPPPDFVPDQKPQFSNSERLQPVPDEKSRLPHLVEGPPQKITYCRYLSLYGIKTRVVYPATVCPWFDPEMNR
jgi:hypothetical protein